MYKRQEYGFQAESAAKATPSEAIEEVQEATPSNAVMRAQSTNLWGGMEMSDHLYGEGTKASPYQINSSKDLKLLAYNVSNEEVEMCIRDSNWVADTVRWVTAYAAVYESLHISLP